MPTVESRAPVQPGEPAPNFTLPAVDRDGTVSLSDYRGKNPLFLAMFRGLWCPFCRRAIAQMGVTRQKLQALGVETLGVVATTPENARLYFKYRPTRVPLAADPELITHRSFGLPKPAVTPELLRALQDVRANPTGELPEPVPLAELGGALDRLHGFQRTETDQADLERQYPQLKGQFLVDRDGIVRWVNIECAKEGLAGLGKFPTDEELVSAARLLST
jgi:peroxiredoxin